MPLSPGARVPFPRLKLLGHKERLLNEDPPSLANFLLCLERSVSCSETKGDNVGISAVFCLVRGSVETRPGEKTVECTLDPLILRPQISSHQWAGLVC